VRDAARRRVERRSHDRTRVEIGECHRGRGVGRAERARGVRAPPPTAESESLSSSEEEAYTSAGSESSLSSSEAEDAAEAAAFAPTARRAARTRRSESLSARAAVRRCRGSRWESVMAGAAPLTVGGRTTCFTVDTIGWLYSFACVAKWRACVAK
jgi:hypothetical protein